MRGGVIEVCDFKPLSGVLIHRLYLVSVFNLQWSSTGVEYMRKENGD